MVADVKRTVTLRNAIDSDDLALLSSNPGDLQAAFDNGTALATKNSWS
jgi:hypothetical protein